MSKGLTVIIVAAVGSNGVIGAKGGLPWHIPSDLKRFRSLTIGKPVIMGRKTFESIGKPLPGRTNIVVSRSVTTIEGALVAESLHAALAAAKQIEGAREVCIIGGGDIYAQALPFADRLEITQVDAQPVGDTVFPPIDPQTWRPASRIGVERAGNDSHATSWITYVRRDAAPVR